jgi:hypothetical protein
MIRPDSDRESSRGYDGKGIAQAPPANPRGRIDLLRFSTLRTAGGHAHKLDTKFGFSGSTFSTPKKSSKHERVNATRPSNARPRGIGGSFCWELESEDRSQPRAHF